MTAGRVGRGLLVTLLVLFVGALLVASTAAIGYSLVASDLPRPSELRARASSFETARIYALAHGIEETSTRRRFEAAAGPMGVAASESEAWIEGFEFLHQRIKFNIADDRFRLLVVQPAVAFKFLPQSIAPCNCIRWNCLALLLHTRIIYNPLKRLTVACLEPIAPQRNVK